MKDLVFLIEDETLQKQHFLGTVVYFENIVNYKTERSIVDGQQRIVTIFLMAQAMKSLTDNPVTKRKLDNNYLKNNVESSSDFADQRLYPSVSDGNDYLLIADEKYDELDKNSESNIVKNFLYLQKELSILIDKYDFEKVLFAIGRFSIVYIKLDERDNAQQIFESINSTGARLTASDLIRNFIMMNKSNKEQTDLYYKYWKKLDSIFPLSKDMEDFFRYYLAAVVGEYSSKQILYSSFKKYWIEQTEQTSETIILDKLVRFSEYFSLLYYKEPVGPYKVIIQDFQNIESMMAAPLVLGLSEMYYHEKINFRGRLF